MAIISGARKGPIYDLDIVDKIKISPETLEETKKRFAELETLAPQVLAENETHLIELKQALDLCKHLQRECFSLPCIQDLKSSESKQLVLLRFFKSLFKSEILLPADFNSFQHMIEEFGRISIHLIFPDDHFFNLDGWMKEIVECRRLFHRYLPAVELEEGDSKGFLWTIVKDNQLRGYLFGTMHQLKTKEAVAATRLCHDIYMRLARCSIIGTEIKLYKSGFDFLKKSDIGESVENQLLKFAKRYGIVNFGLDDEGRDDNTDFELLKGWSLIQDMEIADEAVKSNPELKTLKEIADGNRGFQNCAGRAYREGDSKAMLASFSHSPKDDVDKKRQDALIRKTHGCLQSLEKAAIDRDPIPLGFFAYGIAHMLDASYPKTVVQGLIDLGYDLQPVS